MIPSRIVILDLIEDLLHCHPGRPFRGRLFYAVILSEVEGSRAVLLTYTVPLAFLTTNHCGSAASFVFRL